MTTPAQNETARVLAESRAAMREMVASPNLVFTPETFGATSATMMRASGGPIPGLKDANGAQLPAAKTTNDVAIMNSALLLEYLEAEFYARVVAADNARPYLAGRAARRSSRR